MPCRYDETPEEQAEAARRHEQRITGPLQEEIDTLKAQLNEREAMLCAVMRALDKGGWTGGVFPHINERESGVARSDITSWFVAHKIKDDQRLLQEAAERRRKRDALLARLTPEERDLLSIDSDST